MEVNTLTQPAPTTQQSAQSGAASLSSDFETFLKMLTVQMENQDPLNPIQSSDFAVQLATFSGVEQQVRTNDLLSGLTERLGIGGIGQYAAWVGMEGRAPVAAEFDGTPVTVFPALPTDADQATLIVRDASGGEVQRTALPVPSESFVWNGTDNSGAPVPNGFYSFETEAAADGQPISFDPAEVYGRITEARLDGDAGVVVFADGTSVAADTVSGLRSD
ncbi:MAG: flagellar hook capping FlgD N-terminal domain-containing protein [Pseudomonadota bacterium]